MIGFYHGSSLPATAELKMGVYFISAADGKGKLYRVLADATEPTLIAETNNDAEFAALDAAVKQAQADIAKNKTDVGTALAGLAKITTKHGEELENITNEAASIKEIAQGAATQAATNKADIATANGKIKANEDAIKAIKDGSTIDSFADVESALAGKENAGVAAGLVNSAKTELQGYADAAAKAVDDKLGFTPTADIATVVAYVDKKTADMATSGTITDLQGRVGAIESDYLKAADKTELEGKINTKASQADLNAVSGVANAAATKTALEGEANRAKGEEARIEGLVTAEAGRAAAAEGALDERLVEVETFFKTATDETIDTALDTLVEIQKYITDEGAAADQMVKDIAANKAAIEKEVEDREAAVEDLQDAIDGVSAVANAAAKQSDFNTLKGRVDTAESDIDSLEGRMTATETVANRADAASKANATEIAKKANQSEFEALQSTVSGHTTTIGQHTAQIAAKAEQSALNSAVDRIAANEGAITSINTAIDGEGGVKARLSAVEKKASDNAAAIESNDTDIAALMAALTWKAV